MPPCARQVKTDMQLDGLPEKVHGGVWRQNSAVTAKWRWTCSHVADAAPEWPAAARRDHDGYSDAPGRPVLPDGGTLPRLAHAEKNSETACSRVTDESVRVTPRVPYRRSHTSTNSLSLTEAMPQS